MINAEQQLGSPAGPSAAAILAAALNVANSTSASNSPPELFSLTTTSGSTQLANHPFSPAISQITAASPLNSAAVQHLANAHQLAAAIYNSSTNAATSTSIPSPGGSAFRQQPPHQSAVTAAAAAVAQQLANQHHQQQQSAAMFGAAAGSPAAAAAFAQLEHLARLRNAAAEIVATTAANNTLDIVGQQAAATLTPLQAPPPPSLVPVAHHDLAAIASQLQQQAQALENAANILGMSHSHQQQQQPPPPPHPISLPHQQQLVAALQQHQVVQLQQQVQQAQAHAALNEHAHSQHQASGLVYSYPHPSSLFTNSSGAEKAISSAAQHQLNQQQNPGDQSQQSSSAISHPVRRIRRRRPKDKSQIQRRNSLATGGVKGAESKQHQNSMDSPGSGGPISVQPTTSAGAAELLVPKIEDLTEEMPQSVRHTSAFSSGGGGAPLISPDTNDLSVFGGGTNFKAFNNNNNRMAAMPENSPPSLLDPTTMHHNTQQKPAKQARRDSIEDPDCCRTKTCRVCGDTATGYNFNVISCESCKAFFRRNALRPKEFKCPYANQCEITNVSRRFCQKCRLAKCFEVGMKKEWILSEDQLKRRKNARIKSQMSKDQPKTPSSNGSMQAPATPFGSPPSSAATAMNAFSPPQQQPQQQSQQQQPIYHPQHQQQNQQNQLQAAAAALVFQQGQAQSPFALMAAAAITKLAASPKQLSPGGSIVGLDASPLAAFGVGNSPPDTTTAISRPSSMLNAAMEQPKVSPSSAHSPPPILPAVPQLHQQQQQYDEQQHQQNIMRLAKQQLLQQAQLQQAAAALAQQQQYRRPSDGLLSLAQPQSSSMTAQQQQSPNSTNASSMSPLVEQYQRMMMMQQQNKGPAGNNISASNNIPAGNNMLINLHSPSTIATTSPQQLHSPTGGSARQSGEMPAGCGTTTSSNSITSFPPAGIGGFPNFMNMDAIQRERLMQMRIQSTIQDELGVAMSPPDTARSSPGACSSAAPSKAATPGATPIPVMDENPEIERALERERKLTISRQYQLNSLEQRQMETLKAAFASMDAEMKMELMRNGKFMGILQKEQTQSPADMMCLLDVVMRRFVKLAKRLYSFNDLSPGGKLSLLKAAMMDLLTLRGASRLDTKKECWKSPLMNTEIKCKIDMFDQLNDSKQKQRVMNFYQSLHDKLKTDQVANNLIVVTVLFNHFSDTELSAEDRALAEKHYFSHKHLLERYLQSVYGPDEAKEIYEKVPEALIMLKDVTKKVSELFTEDKIDKREAEGTLFKEFFHLNKAKEQQNEMAVEKPAAEEPKRPNIEYGEAKME